MNCICDTGDEKLDAMLRTLLGNFCITSSDGGTLLVTCDPVCAASDGYAAVIVLYTGERYTYSEEHRGLIERYGEKYRAVSRPVDIAMFCEVVRELGTEKTYMLPQTDEEGATYSERVITYRGRTVRLTAKEDALFRLMYEHRGKVVSRERIAVSVWDGDVSTNVTDVYMSYLRRKLVSIFGNGILTSVRGEGYILNTSVTFDVFGER